MASDSPSRPSKGKLSRIRFWRPQPTENWNYQPQQDERRGRSGDYVGAHHSSGNNARNEPDGATDREAHHGQAGECHDVGSSNQAFLPVRAKDQTVERHRSAKQSSRKGRQEQGRNVEVALIQAEPVEARGKGQGE